MENIYQDKHKVFDSLLRAQRESALLEIFIGGNNNREHFGSRLLPFPDYQPIDRTNAILGELSRKMREAANDGDRRIPPRAANTDAMPSSFLIFPLEPTVGNLKIRKVPHVVIRFFIGVELYEISASFQRVLMVGGTQAIEMSMPGAIRIRPRRQQSRANVPPETNLTVKVQKRGSAGFTAILMDISPGGISFASPDQHDLLEMGDKVGVSILGPLLQGTPISVFGSVCRISRVRDERDNQTATQQYGIQFKLLSVADAMTIDRIVKELSKKSRSP